MIRQLFILPLFSLAAITGIQAQSHYPGQHAGKFAVPDQLQPAVYSFDLSDVRLLDGHCKQNMEREQQWLLAIDIKKLLHSFRVNAGIFDANEGGYFDIKKYGGWESLDCELRGHTTGHLLSGLALMYAQTGEPVYKAKADSIVMALSEVQTVLDQDGYLSAFPQELINRNLAGKKVWAPWYTLHKIMAGLIDQYLYCDNQQALAIVSKMGDWAYKKLQPVTPAQRTIMLRNEFGGINESFYNLYAITGKPAYQWLAAFFYHNEMLDPLKEGKDILDKKHANTYIPKLLGMTREYEIDGKGDGDSIAAFFWNTVITHHSFVTGSNSDKEKFFTPDDLSDHLTGYTGETCNVYNMLKLTRHLFTHTGDIRYADFYEKALFNHILGQQDPATGMVAYFLPMLPGAHKVYSTKENSFWCCVGTGFENHAKYGEAIYYHSNDALYVNLFIASTINWKEKGFSMKQETNFPESDTMLFTIQQAPATNLALHIRYPSWATSALVTVNGKKLPVKQAADTYITIQREWKANDKVTVVFPMALTTQATNDNPNKAAILYGPIVLAGEMGTAQMDAPAPYSNPALYNDYYTYNYHVPANLVTALSVNKNNLAASIQPVNGQPLSFKTVKEDITLRPLYDVHRERYVVYWNIK
ncbi:hypothetical protein F5148DRAFT_985779 [Russula earlei]|uniref:Uncharacterized protein n=1 Tax=Russula earlei TaxID=71964 RepID=A0ACC0TXM3_9AGAM|nr:hypothetical protein F5148DRAFT_985779 [Russula earlei]